jgi:hypothetical protein
VVKVNDSQQYTIIQENIRSHKRRIKTSGTQDKLSQSARQQNRGERKGNGEQIKVSSDAEELHTRSPIECKYRQHASFIKTNTANVFTRRNRTYLLESGVEKSISVFVIVTQHLFIDVFLRQRHCPNLLCLPPPPSLPNAISDAATP